MTVYTREGKDAVRVGDSVKVASATLTRVHPQKDRGWRGGKVIRFMETPSGLVAEVTVPGRASTRIVDAERLTHQRSRT